MGDDILFCSKQSSPPFSRITQLVTDCAGDSKQVRWISTQTGERKQLTTMYTLRLNCTTSVAGGFSFLDKSLNFAEIELLED